MPDYPTHECSKTISNLISQTEIFFTVFFTFEFFVKSIAYGVVYDKHSYLRDRWNWIDFVVVAIRWGESNGGGGDAPQLDQLHPRR